MVLQKEPFVLQASCEVATGNRYSSAEAMGVGQDEVIWTCFADATTPFFKRLFGKLDTTPARQKLDAALKEILTVQLGGVEFVAELKFDDSSFDT